MPRETKRKNIIAGAIVGVIAIVVAVVLIVVFAATRKQTLGDSYFVSDDSKYVLTMDLSDNSEEEGSDLNPLKSHAVYYYSGDTITGLKTYYEYKTEEAAKTIYDSLKDSVEESPAEKIELDGKYIVMTMPASDYENATATQIKEEIDWYNSYVNSGEETIEETVEETTEGTAQE